MTSRAIQPLAGRKKERASVALLVNLDKMSGLERETFTA
jgi:hypothetical protein